MKIKHIGCSIKGKRAEMLVSESNFNKQLIYVCPVCKEKVSVEE